MANEQHLEWLLEGVEAWNERMKTAPVRADLSGADLRGADLRDAKLRSANLEFAVLERSKLGGADLFCAKLNKAILREADLTGANLSVAELRDTDLRGAYLDSVKLGGAKITGADVRTIDPSTAVTKVTATGKYAKLSPNSFLVQGQLDRMIGDNGTLIPDHLTRPAHWETIGLPPDHPNYEGPKPKIEWSDWTDHMAKVQTTYQADLDGERVTLTTSGPPIRKELEVIYTDLRDDIPLLVNRFANVSASFDKFMTRYASIVAAEFTALDQIRFGVQTKALRQRFDNAHEDFKAISPDSIGEIEAALMSAELICARLPDWQDFLTETEEDAETVQDRATEIDAALEEAQQVIAQDEEHYDVSISIGLRDYLDTKSIEAYLAASDMLNAVAFRIATEVQSFVKDTQGEARKMATKAVAGAFITGVGSVMTKLAGILPREFEWFLPWLKYIPTIL